MLTNLHATSCRPGARDRRAPGAGTVVGGMKSADSVPSVLVFLLVRPPAGDSRALPLPLKVFAELLGLGSDMVVVGGSSIIGAAGEHLRKGL